MDEKKDVVAQEVEATEPDSTQEVKEEQTTEEQVEEQKELIRQLKLKVDGEEEVMDLPFEVDEKQAEWLAAKIQPTRACLLYTSPSPRDRQKSRMPSSA